MKKPIIGVTMNHFMSVTGSEFDNVGFSRSPGPRARTNTPIPWRRQAVCPF